MNQPQELPQPQYDDGLDGDDFEETTPGEVQILEQYQKKIQGGSYRFRMRRYRPKTDPLAVLEPGDSGGEEPTTIVCTALSRVSLDSAIDNPEDISQHISANTASLSDEAVEEAYEEAMQECSEALRRLIDDANQIISSEDEADIREAMEERPRLLNCLLVGPLVVKLDDPQPIEGSDEAEPRWLTGGTVTHAFTFVFSPTRKLSLTYLATKITQHLCRNTNLLDRELGPVTMRAADPDKPYEDIDLG